MREPNPTDNTDPSDTPTVVLRPGEPPQMKGALGQPMTRPDVVTGGCDRCHEHGWAIEDEFDMAHEMTDGDYRTLCRACDTLDDGLAEQGRDWADYHRAVGTVTVTFDTDAPADDRIFRNVLRIETSDEREDEVMLTQWYEGEAETFPVRGFDGYTVETEVSY